MALATPPVIASGLNMLNMSKTAKILQNLDILGNPEPLTLKMRPDVLSLLLYLYACTNKEFVGRKSRYLLTN